MRARPQHPLIAPGAQCWNRFAAMSDGRWALAGRCTETGHPMATFGHPKIPQRLHNHDSCIDAGGALATPSGNTGPIDVCIRDFAEMIMTFLNLQHTMAIKGCQRSASA